MNTADAALSSPLRRHRLSVEDYHRMGEAGILGTNDRVELIDGEIIDMTPIGSRHASIVNRLTELLVPTCRGRAIVSVQNPIVLGDDSEPEPDIALLFRREDFYAEATARASEVLLAIEVADATLAYDRDVKLPLYARHGIPETWLIDVGGARLTIHREIRDGRYTRAEAPDDLQAVELSHLDGVRLDLSSLF